MNKFASVKKTMAVVLMGISAITLCTACNNPAKISVNKTDPALIVTAEPTATPKSDHLLQEEALTFANAILQTSSYSKEGLIAYLVNENSYTTAVAEYAVNNCGADWNAQAVGVSRSLLGYSSYSRTGLIDDLIDEGFTSEQAVYGADNCNADWNAEALEFAMAYTGNSDISRDELISILIGYGFTQEQAEYGADNATGQY